MSINSLVVPSAGLEGQTLAMSAQASSTISGASLNYQWNFGDGTSQSGVNLTSVSHAYAAPAKPGTPYTVTLTVNDGTTPQSATSSVNITDVPPTVSAGPSQIIRAGSAATFQGSASDPGGASDITSIQWDFNYNGSTFSPYTPANGNLTPSYTYATPGTYLVAMQATDKGGNVSQDITTVTVKPADALIANAGSDLTVTAGTPVNLSGSYSDPGGSVASSGIAWDTNYNGSTFNPVVTGTLTPTTTFSTPGTYQVALQITDSTGVSDLSILNVTVNPVSHTGPTANAGSNQTLNEGSTASFNGSYTDPDGTVSSSGIAWDFNYDGVTFTPQTTGTLTPTYQFTTPGTYTVALQVTDSNGLTSLSTLTVTVNAVTPTVSAGHNLTVTAGQLVQMNGTASVPSGANDPLTYAWDFNYNGTTLNPGSASTLTPYHVFTTPGTYTVALQAADSEGVSGLSTITVTVNPSNSLVVNAGPDQALAEGDTATFAGSWTDGSGTVNASSAQWDFNYDGSNFVANPSANGTLTPSYPFTTPGTYLVALKLTDSNNVSSIGVMYVSVASVAPTVDAGPDQTVNQGATVSFAGTASEPSGANDPMTYAWDFDYDGQNFNAMSTGTLTPTYVYTTPGTYQAALQVTDSYGQVSLETTTVTVNDVPPTATVTNSGPANVGVGVTFTVSNLVDHTPGDTPTYLVDWTGSGTFEELTSDQLTTQNGKTTFTHSYDTPSGPSGYNAVVEIVDGSGGSTNYTTNVVVNDTLPPITLGPNGTSFTAVDASTPFRFGFRQPPQTNPQTTYTYYVSLDGGAYTSSSSPTYQLPSNIRAGHHTLTGYVVDSYGAQSQTVTWSGTVATPSVLFVNDGNGQVNVNGTVLNPSQDYTLNNSTTPLNVTLLTSGASYQLYSNVAIASLNAASGVTGVNVSVSTGSVSGSMVVGDDHIGTIAMPANSTLSASTPSDLTSLTGPSGNGTLTGVTVTNLSFYNLDGSITGVDSIQTLGASGWLGTSPSQVVDVAAGINTLNAYGVGATVIADERQDAGDPAMSVGIGNGGVTGTIEAGTVSNVEVAGDVNNFYIQTLAGGFDPPDIKGTLTVRNEKDVEKLMRIGTANTIVFDGNSPGEIPQIFASGAIQKLVVNNNLTVARTKDGVGNGTIKAASIGSITGSGSLNASSIIASSGTIGTINLKGNLILVPDPKDNPNAAGAIQANDITSITVGGNLTANIKEKNGSGTAINVTGNFTGTMSGGAGQTGEISVGGDFTPPSNGNVLVGADHQIGDVTVGGDIGNLVGGKPNGIIQGSYIGNIESQSGSILLSEITTTDDKVLGGTINAVSAPAGDLKAAVFAKGGNIRYVEAYAVQGSLTAKADDTNKTAAFGGNILYVHSTLAIPKTVRMQADWYVGQITTKNTAGDAEAFNVYAQGGVQYNAQGVVQGAGTLVINAGAGNYVGTVSLGAPASLKALAPKFKNGDVLLTLIQKTKATSWTVSLPGNDTATTTVDAVFAKLNTGIFGLVKSSLRLSDPDFEITGGPSGRQ